MPYITPSFRKALTPTVRPTGPCELNFVLTAVCNEYLQRCGISYNAVNDVIGSLECAKLEMYRRRVALYEDGRMKEYGDVYLP